MYCVRYENLIFMCVKGRYLFLDSQTMLQLIIDCGQLQNLFQICGLFISYSTVFIIHVLLRVVHQ
jgi:hypothetical protein